MPREQLSQAMETMRYEIAYRTLTRDQWVDFVWEQRREQAMRKNVFSLVRWRMRQSDLRCRKETA